MQNLGFRCIVFGVWECRIEAWRRRVLSLGVGDLGFAGAP